MFETNDQLQFFRTANQPKLAVLIDTDNISARFTEALFNEIADIGDATVRRAYGDWATSNHLEGWRNILHKYAIHPILQFNNTSNKNATDIALVIDAMDLLYTERFDGFCLVSSDSDFTRLASRIREQGKKVYGFGEKKTPNALSSNCDKFIYLENLINLPQTTVITNPNDNHELIEAVKSVVEQHADDDGWVNPGNVGSFIAHRFPDFDPRSYGCTKMTEVLKQFEDLHLEKREISLGNWALMIRLR